VRNWNLTTHKRIRDLFDKRSVSRQELDEAEARVRVARSGVEMAEARRKQVDEKIRQGEETVASARVMTGFTEIRAPFAGRVVARLAEPGVIAAPGMPLVEIEQTGGYRLEAQVEACAGGNRWKCVWRRSKNRSLDAWMRLCQLSTKDRGQLR
jgi:multidrug resistance efflux pump